MTPTQLSNPTHSFYLNMHGTVYRGADYHDAFEDVSATQSQPTAQSWLARKVTQLKAIKPSSTLARLIQTVKVVVASALYLLVFVAVVSVRVIGMLVGKCKNQGLCQELSQAHTAAKPVFDRVAGFKKPEAAVAAAPAISAYASATSVAEESAAAAAAAAAPVPFSAGRVAGQGILLPRTPSPVRKKTYAEVVTGEASPKGVHFGEARARVFSKVDKPAAVGVLNSVILADLAE